MSSFPAAEDEGDDDFGGVRQSELVNWYLKEMEHEIESVAELTEMETIVKKVIHKLINQVFEVFPTSNICCSLFIIIS